MNSSTDDGRSSRLDHVNDPHSHGIDKHHLIGPQRVAVRSRCGRLGEHAVWQWMQRDPGRHLLADTDIEILAGGSQAGSGRTWISQCIAPKKAGLREGESREAGT